MKKAQLNISFGWLFAIIIGSVILILTIILAVTLINTGGDSGSTVLSKQFLVNVGQLETGAEKASKSEMHVRGLTRITSSCNEFGGEFGNQEIEFSQKSFNKWTNAQPTSIENRYIFSEENVEGKKFFLLSQPFEFPFKVGDLVILTSEQDEYCFRGSMPSDIVDVLRLQTNFFVGSECETGKDYINICFEDFDCDIVVDYDSGEGEVEKNGETIPFYGDALLFAAMFSDKETYTCQVDRLMQRIEILSEIYIEKELRLKNVCPSYLGNGLNSLKSRSGNFGEDLSELRGLGFLVEGLDRDNKGECRLW